MQRAADEDIRVPYTVQRKETPKPEDFADISACPLEGRLLSVDPGTKFVGIAVSDKTQTVTRPVKTLQRTSWKKLLIAIKELVSDFDAKAVVVGLPLGFEGDEIPMTAEALDLARKLSLSLTVPVFLQDERVTTYDARKRIWERGISPEKTKVAVDGEAAAIILSDFIERVGQIVRPDE